MPGKVTLTITSGPKEGMMFVFEQHETLLLGRRDDCHVCLPEDMRLSRRHFLLEINPPAIRLRDLRSLHGTYVNGQKYGGQAIRRSSESDDTYPILQINLKDGDEIRAGQTIFRVRVEEPPRSLQTVICQRCGDKMQVEAGAGENDQLFCEFCREKALEDPGSFLLSFSQPSQALFHVGMDISDYRVVELLSKRNMGSVYLVRRHKDGKQVVLKALLARGTINERARRQFFREMEATSALRHPHIIRFLGSGIYGEIMYFLMEYCEGGDVATLMQNRGGKLSLEEAAPLLLQTLQGLAFAHQQGFVHRDIKPENILLRGGPGSWSVRLADLGLAKNFEQFGGDGLTITGDKAGSSSFMPPEQLANLKDVKPVSDVWAMGATCYAILTGSLPRSSLEHQDQIEAVMDSKVIPIRTRDPHIPNAIAQVIDRALAREVHARYQHAGEMYEALKKAFASERKRQKN